MIVAALYRFLHASDEADHRSTLRAEGCKLRASSLLSLAFRRRLSAMDKADRKVCSQFVNLPAYVYVRACAVVHSALVLLCPALALASRS